MLGGLFIEVEPVKSVVIWDKDKEVIIEVNDSPLLIAGELLCSAKKLELNCPAVVLPLSDNSGDPITSFVPVALVDGVTAHKLFEKVNPVTLGTDTTPVTILLTI